MFSDHVRAYKLLRRYQCLTDRTPLQIEGAHARSGYTPSAFRAAVKHALGREFSIIEATAQDLAELAAWLSDEIRRLTAEIDRQVAAGERAEFEYPFYPRGWADAMDPPKQPEPKVSTT